MAHDGLVWSASEMERSSYHRPGGLDTHAPELFNYAILGFALSEATGLFALMVSFMVLFT